MCVPYQAVTFLVVALMGLLRPNLDVKLVNVQVSVLGFRDDYYFRVPRPCIKSRAHG